MQREKRAYPLSYLFYLCLIHINHKKRTKMKIKLEGKLTIEGGINKYALLNDKVNLIDLIGMFDNKEVEIIIKTQTSSSTSKEKLE